MEFIAAMLFTLVVISWVSKSTQQPKRIPRKPKHKQYNEGRYAEYFMTKVSKVYNIQERPKQESQEEDDFIVDEIKGRSIELEKKSDPPPIWLSQQDQDDPYESEDMKIRSKFFDKTSKILEYTGILWLLGISLAEKNFPNFEHFLAGKTLISLLVKITPIMFLLIAIVTKILGNRNKSRTDRVFTIIHGIFMLLLGIGYLANQLSNFLSS